ncbi:MAG: membrane lipoprotein lipid attachment site-containing protein [Candidatus Falkowbacteria bacterium]|nr:membrane lipoprotein lipid attachment site-containing protein [Candidatus Falkowbacteria bacterium]
MKKIVYILPLLLILTGCSNDSGYSSSYDDSPSYSESFIDESEELDTTRNDGTHSVEACNNTTGDCYDLDAEISDGEVEQIQFSNGGHLDLDGATLDEDGSASGDSYTDSEGYDGDTWDVTCTDCE